MSEITICPLCQESVPPEELDQHKREETNEMILATVEMIKRSNPAWVEESGACSKCWEHYKKL